MANKRQKKKKLKQQQRQQIKKSGYVGKPDRLSYKQLQVIIADLEKKEKEKEKKESRKNSRLSRISKKRFGLEKLGFSDATLSKKFSNSVIDKIKLSDIEKGNISRDKYPFLFDLEGFDYNRVYSFNGKKLYIAYRDFQGEIDIAEEFKKFSKYSNDELINGIDAIIHAIPTGQKNKPGTSGGKSGEYRFMLGSKETITIMNSETRNDDNRANRKRKNQKNYESMKEKRKKKRGHFKGDNVTWQKFKDKETGQFFNNITPRKLLEIANTILYNVTEDNRTAFYNRFYSDIVRTIPDMEKILPKL